MRFECQNILERHHEALNKVRKASWNGTYEDQLLPSNSALQLHWYRACWVGTVWSKAAIPYFRYPDVNHYEYTVSQENGNTLVGIQWDTEENVNQLKPMFFI